MTGESSTIPESWRLLDRRPVTRVPRHVPRSLGYEGPAALVAFYWEPCGDELAWEDSGGTAACGMGENYAWLDLQARWPALREALVGNSDEPAQECLLCENTTDGRCWLAPLAEVRPWLEDQRLGKPRTRTDEALPQ